MDVLRIDPLLPDDDVLMAAAEVVLRGGVIAFPTDTSKRSRCWRGSSGAILLWP
jgi:hypothetical protein